MQPTHSPQMKLWKYILVLFSTISLNSISNPLTAQISGPTQACENDTMTYSHPQVGPPAVSYNWSITGGFINSAIGKDVHVTWTNPGIGKLYITLIETVGGAVHSRDTFDVTINSNTVPSITASPEYVCNDTDQTGQILIGECKIACEGSTITYTAPLNSGSTYQWIAPGALISPVSPNVVDITWVNVGLSSVKVIETNSNGCIGEHEVCVEIIEKPKAYFTSPSMTAQTIRGCIGQNLIFIDSSLEAASWLWNFGDGTTSELQNPNHAYSSPGTYAGTLTVKNECGCEDIAYFTAIIEEEVTPEIECISTVCPGAAASYMAVMPDPTTVCAYSWQVQGGTISGGQNTNQISVNWADTTSGFGLITLNVSNCNNVICPLPVSVKVPIISKLTDMSGKSRACRNSQEVYRIPPVPGSIFSWAVSGGTLAINSLPTIQGQANLREVAVDWGSGTSGTITVFYYNQTLGCGDTISKAVTLLEPFEITGVNQVCSSTSENYTTSPAGNFQWQMLDESGLVVAGPVFGSNANFNFTGSGEYTILAQDTNSLFCNEFARYKVKSVGIPPTPIAPIGDLEICPETYYEYNGQVPSAEYSLKWEFQNGTSSNVYGESALVKWTGSGPWSIKLFQEAIEAPHCVSDSLVTLISHKPNPVPDLSGNDTSCINSTTAFLTTAEADRYEWEITPAGYGSITYGQYTKSIQVEWHNLSGNATVQLVTKVCDSSNTNSKSVYLKAQPIPEIIGYGTYCKARLDSFAEVTNHPTAISWFWEFGDGITKTTTTNKVQHTFNQDGSLPVKVTVTYGGTCSGTSAATEIFDVLPVPEATLTSNMNTSICPANGSVSNGQQLSVAIHSPSGYTFDWFKDGVGISNSGSTYTPSGLGSFQVRITNNTSGCLAWTNTLVIDTCISSGGSGGSGTTCPKTASYRPDFTYTNNQAQCGQVDFVPSGGTFVGWDFGDPNPGGTSSGNTHYYQSSGHYQVRLGATFIYNGAPCTADTVKTVSVGHYGDFATELECLSSSSMNLVLNSTANYVGVPITVTEYVVNTIPPTSSVTYTGTNHTIASTPGDYSVSMTVRAGGSPCTITDTVTVLQPGEADFTLPTGNYCEGTPVDFTDASLGSIVGWDWDFVEDNAGSNLNNPSRTFRANQSPIVPFPYGIKLVTTDHLGCKDSVTKVVSVFNNELANGNAFISPTTPLPVCDGDSVALTSDLAPSVTSTIATNLWSNLKTTSTIHAKETGSYTVEVTDNRNCREITEPASVGVIPNSAARIFGDTEYCLGEEVQLNQYRGDTSVFTYTWLKNGAFFASGATLTDQPSLAGTYIYGAVADNGICPETTYTSVSILNPPVVNSVTASPDVCASSLPTLTANATGKAPLSYGWSSGGNTNSVKVNTGGLYAVTVTDSIGCETVASILIEKETDFSNLMTGCYTFCANDTSDVEIQGMGSAYTHNWTDLNNVSLQTTPTYFITGITNHNFQLIATKSSCADTSDQFKVNVADCRDCSQITDLEFDSIWCVGPDPFGVNDWIYGFSFKLDYPFGTASINVDAPGGVVKNLSKTTVVNGVNTVSGIFQRTDVHQDSLLLSITLNAGPNVPGLCVLQLKDTLNYCPEDCDMAVFWEDLFCAGLSTNGNSGYYFEARLESDNLWPWNVAVFSEDDGIVKQIDTKYKVNNGNNYLEGFWEIDGAVSSKCLVFEVQNPRSGKCCSYTLCETIAACPASDTCKMWAPGFNWAPNSRASASGNGVTSWGMRLRSTEPTVLDYAYSSDELRVTGLSPSQFSPGMNLLNGIAEDFRTTGSFNPMNYTIFCHDPGSQYTCQYDSHFNFPFQPTPALSTCVSPTVNVIGNEVTCMGTVNGNRTYAVKIILERPNGDAWPEIGMTTSDGEITNLIPAFLPRDNSIVYDTLSFFYTHKSGANTACFMIFVHDVNSNQIKCDFTTCISTDPADCCFVFNPPRLKPPFAANQNEDKPDNLNEFALKVRPNPSNQSTNIDFNFGESLNGNRIVVLNNLQHPVASFEGLSGSGTVHFKTEELETGLYFVMALNASGEMDVLKLIITH